MTGLFRKVGYEVVEAHVTAPNHTPVEVVVGTMRWELKLGELKQMLWQDRQRRKRDRKVAHAR